MTNMEYDNKIYLDVLLYENLDLFQSSFIWPAITILTIENLIKIAEASIVVYSMMWKSTFSAFVKYLYRNLFDFVGSPANPLWKSLSI